MNNKKAKALRRLAREKAFREAWDQQAYFNVGKVIVNRPRTERGVYRILKGQARS